MEILRNSVFHTAQLVDSRMSNFYAGFPTSCEANNEDIAITLGRCILIRRIHFKLIMLSKCQTCLIITLGCCWLFKQCTPRVKFIITYVHFAYKNCFKIPMWPLNRKFCFSVDDRVLRHVWYSRNCGSRDLAESEMFNTHSGSICHNPGIGHYS